MKLVLISGPSSSGKTTFSKRLSVQLMTNGLRPYPISLDNYFVDREDTPRDENGNYDYESLYALDLELFNTQLQALLRGEEVELPRFNFNLGKKEYKGDKLRIDEHTILILEGIHALNPELTPQIPAASKYKIYVSALTTISLDDHNWIPTTDNRLLRRIIATSTTAATRHKRPFHAGPVYVPARTNGYSPTRKMPTLCSTPPSCSNSPCSAATQSPSLPVFHGTVRNTQKPTGC